MKALFKWVGLVCLSCNALHAGMYLSAFTAKNGQYLCADNGGGGGLDANRSAIGPWETFIAEDLWAGTEQIVSGDPVGIRNAYTNKYWCTEPTQPYIVVNRDVRGPWETFIQLGSFVDGGKAHFYVARPRWGQGGGPEFQYVHLNPSGGNQIKWYSYGYSSSDMEFTVTILAYMPEPAP